MAKSIASSISFGSLSKIRTYNCMSFKLSRNASRKNIVNKLWAGFEYAKVNNLTTSLYKSYKDSFGLRFLAFNSVLKRCDWFALPNRLGNNCTILSAESASVEFHWTCEAGPAKHNWSWTNRYILHIEAFKRFTLSIDRDPVREYSVQRSCTPLPMSSYRTAFASSSLRRFDPSPDAFDRSCWEHAAPSSRWRNFSHRRSLRRLCVRKDRIDRLTTLRRIRE